MKSTAGFVRLVILSVWASVAIPLQGQVEETGAAQDSVRVTVRGEVMDRTDVACPAA